MSGVRVDVVILGGSLIGARRAVEREAAALAALNASAEEIQQLKKIVEQQDVLTRRREVAINEGAELNEAIASAHDSVLHTLVSLRNNPYPSNDRMSYIRAQVDGRLVMDPSAISGALERRDATIWLEQSIGVFMD